LQDRIWVGDGQVGLWLYSLDARSLLYCYSSRRLHILGMISLSNQSDYRRGIGKTEKRRLVDNFKIWPSSGGGGPKVSKLWVSFRYPWYFLPHPVVLLGTAYFSLFLATNDYIMTTNSISYPTVYGFSLGDVALTSISPTLGNVFGIIYGGYFNDMVNSTSNFIDNSTFAISERNTEANSVLRCGCQCFC
jgi:hypothetical protein